MKVALDFEYDTFSIDKEKQNMCPVKIGLIFILLYIYFGTHSKSMYLVRSFVLNA